MRNLKLLLFFIFLGVYALGIAIGGIRQVKSENPDMYEYLSGAVSEYAPAAVKSIKSVASDNVKLLAVLALGGLFKAGIILIPAAMLLKGYTAGFSITAVIRLYGIKGLILCGANILSVMLLIPSIAYYGSVTSYNLLQNPMTKGEYLKKYFLILIFLTAIFCIDSLLRGFLSSTFMKFSDFITKSA